MSIRQNSSGQEDKWRLSLYHKVIGNCFVFYYCDCVRIGTCKNLHIYIVLLFAIIFQIMLMSQTLSHLRSSHRRSSIKKTVLKNFTIFTGKRLCSSLLLIRLQAFRPAASLKRDSNTGVFL